MTRLARHWCLPEWGSNCSTSTPSHYPLPTTQAVEVWPCGGPGGENGPTNRSATGSQAEHVRNEYRHLIRSPVQHRVLEWHDSESSVLHYQRTPLVWATFSFVKQHPSNMQCSYARGRGKARTLRFKQDSGGWGRQIWLEPRKQSEFSDSGLHQLEWERQTVEGACYIWVWPGGPTCSSYNTSVTHVENSPRYFHSIDIR